MLCKKNMDFRWLLNHAIDLIDIPRFQSSREV